MRTIRDVMHGDIEVLRTTETAADAAAFLASHTTRTPFRSARATAAWPAR